MGTWADTKGPTPGSDKAVNMHKGIAMGMPAPASKRCVYTKQKATSTGSTKAPGLSNR